MVKVEYGEPYRTSFGKEEEKIKADTLGNLINNIEEKYKGKDHVDTIMHHSMILLNNELFLSKNNLEYKLRPKDEILIIQFMTES